MSGRFEYMVREGLISQKATEATLYTRDLEHSFRINLLEDINDQVGREMVKMREENRLPESTQLRIKFGLQLAIPIPEGE